ncbi:MAG: lipoyl synthase [Chlorobi bacterium]|nr:lipoyl synthase [Chlorobiota bacterium]
MEERRGRRRRLPDWMRMEMPRGETYSKVKNLVRENHLHTICTSGNCPNIGECWNAGTATFMILGDICTRSCRFCAVKTGKPFPVDRTEPARLAESIRIMKVKHCVITSVDRDDLPDGGASFWAETIRTVKQVNPVVTIETLIPDFNGKKEDIDKVIDTGPEVISHNLETVKRLTPKVRNKNIYSRSLDVLSHISSRGIITKSGIMVGLGETGEEVGEAMDDLLASGCQVITIGQYLQPTLMHFPVREYVTPEKFASYKKLGLEKGFRFVESSPLVRSSYHAERHIHAVAVLHGAYKSGE